MEVISLKMSSGEELIGRFYVSDSSEKQYTMSHVHTIGLQKAPDGNLGIGLMDYILSDKNCKISINASHVVAKFSPSYEVEKAYNSTVSSIQLY